MRFMNESAEIILLALVTTDAHSRLRLSNSLNITEISKSPAVDEMMEKKSNGTEKNLFYLVLFTTSEYRRTNVILFLFFFTKIT